MLLTRRTRAVGALALDQWVAWGALHYAYPVLAPALARGLGLPLSGVAAAFSAGLLAGAAATPFVAKATARFGPRAVLRAGAALGTSALLALATARGTCGLVGGMLALGLAQATSLYEAALAEVVAMHPSDAARRERALLALTIVGGFASTAFLPASTWLLDAVGWRAAFGALALAFGAVALVARGAALPHGRTSSARTAPAAAPPLARLAPLGAAFAVLSFASTGVALFLVPTLIEGGWSPSRAAVAAGVVGAMQVPGRIAFALLPKGSQRLRLGGVVVAQALGLVALTRTDGLALGLGIVLYGAGAGVLTLARATTLLERFGPEAYPTASGVTAAGALVARALAPAAMELGHQRVGLRTELVLLAGALVATVPLVARGAPWSNAGPCRSRPTT